MVSSGTESPVRGGYMEPHMELHFSDSDEDDNGGDREEESDGFPFTGDYSSRMEEIMSGEGDGEGEVKGYDVDSDDDDEEEEEEGFFYTGVDSTPAAASNYRDRLREILGQDELTDETEDEEDVLASGSVPKLVIEEEEEEEGEDHVATQEPVINRTASATSSFTSASPSSRVITPVPRKASSKIARPFLDPTVSRLRSHVLHPSSSSSNLQTSLSNSFISSSSHKIDSTAHTHTLSRASSSSNLNSYSHQPSSVHAGNHAEVVKAVIQSVEKDVFRWTSLQGVTKEVYAPASSAAVRKAMSVLGAQRFEAPTVLAANGYICIGTSDGKVVVYDFRQNLKCVCGEDSSENRVGAVTALALSHDHTCIAAGFSTGYIQIYNLTTPMTPIRSVPPTSLSLVYSGRKEGHIQGSRITSIGFIAGRHTAIVSADVHGLAFYHALGKVLFVEASDVLRILGRYPDPQPPPPPPHSRKHDPRVHTVKQRNPRYTILMMAPLPLGAAPHVTDDYNLVALLTPTKLVVVGLKPKPKTWFKVTRGLEEGGEWRSQMRWKGSVAWFPCHYQGAGTGEGENGKTNGGGNSSDKGKIMEDPTKPLVAPVLAFSWGNQLRVIGIEEVKVKQVLKNAKTGKEREAEVGTIFYQDVLSWASREEILAIQWLNAQQLVILTPSQMGVYDLQISKLIERMEFDASMLMSPTLGSTASGNTTYQDSVRDVSHSIRIYKGKIFLLGRTDLQVGTLLTWADRILSLVEDGDFLSAIELARSYYLDEAPGNRNGLPTDPQLRKVVIGNKLQDLMVASARYAFSEDRMTDSTHVTPDGRGVDRTALFESLITTCCHACIALDDTEFLFEDLFQKYDDSGISAIYLRHLEPFMLNNEIRNVPPRITQRLVSLHEQEERPDLVERVIWHIDPACLDINQAIRLCQEHHLYDALIYVYTRALRDYVAPIVDLLGLIRQVLVYRRARAEGAEDSDDDGPEPESGEESMILNSYKVYPYLTHVLTGLTYPSGEPLPEDEAFQAKKDIYTFLFYGRSSVWPPGEGGKLILTSDVEGGDEPTYPYIRQLLQWDAESFLHSLDLAFEDTYLNDQSQSVNRLIIVRILMELVIPKSLSSEDAIFVYIFIARNVPKYPQFLQVAPSLLHKTLENLAAVDTPETREDRQLAAEHLLSVYNPHDIEDIAKLFEDAKFYRILRRWHRREQRWNYLFMTYLDDSDIATADAFENLSDVLATAKRLNKGVIPPPLVATVERALGRLVQIGISETALLLQQHLPQLHDLALDTLDDETADNKRFVYLQTLLSPPETSDDDQTRNKPSPTSSPHLRRTFLDLQCRLNPQDTVSVLEALPPDFLPWDDIIQTCETNQVYDAVVWAHDAQGNTQGAIDKAVSYHRNIALHIVELLQGSSEDPKLGLDHTITSLWEIGRRSIDACVRRSRTPSGEDVPLEDIWFTLLNSQINVLQLASSREPSNSALDEGIKSKCLSELRSLVQSTFGALVPIASISAVSFPRLFKRLANSTTSTTYSHYDEFRTILTGMLESYRSDGDMLTITKQLVERDLFNTMSDLVRKKSRGWTLQRGVCLHCRHSLSKKPPVQKSDASDEADDSIFQVVVTRSGKAYHTHCYRD